MNHDDQAFFAQMGVQNEKDQQSQIARAKRIKYVLNGIAWILFIFAVFHVELASLGFHLVLLIYLCLNLSSTSVLRIYFRETTLPNTLSSVFAILCGSLLLWTRQIVDHQNLSLLVMMSSVLAIGLLLLIYLSTDVFHEDYTFNSTLVLAGLLVVGIFIYSINLLSLVNCMGQASILTTTSYEILSKDFSPKTRPIFMRHKLTIIPENAGVLTPHIMQHWIEVPKADYDAKRVGDLYEVHSYKGRLGVRWTRTNGF